VTANNSSNNILTVATKVITWPAVFLHLRTAASACPSYTRDNPYAAMSASLFAHRFIPLPHPSLFTHAHLPSPSPLSSGPPPLLRSHRASPPRRPSLCRSDPIAPPLPTALPCGGGVRRPRGAARGGAVRGGAVTPWGARGRALQRCMRGCGSVA